MKHLVNLWIGNFSTREDFEMYTKETYADDDPPINQFAADQGETFYDHDFVEIEFLEDRPSLESVILRLSFGATFVDQALAAAKSHEVGEFNAVFADFDNQFGSPQSFTADEYSLVYLGKFEHERIAPSLPAYEVGDRIYLKLHSTHSELPTGISVSPDYPFTIGTGKASLDLSALVPGIAEFQVEIRYVPEKERWELRDLGSNGLTMYGKEPIDGEFRCPFNGIRFSVGDIEFDWSVEP